MTDGMWKVLEHTNDWLRFADTKASGALAGSGVLGGLAANALLDDATHISCPALPFVLVGLVGLVVAAGLAMSVIAPRLNAGEPTSLIYYEHVARKYKRDGDAHYRDLQAMLDDDAALSNQLANQILANANVARQKYIFSSWSLLALAVSLLMLGIGAGIAALT